MDNVINKYYEENYYPNLDELYSILKNDNINVSKKIVKEFLEKQDIEQKTKEVKRKKNESHIVAFYKNQLWQLDIFVLKKYSKYNEGYGYILCAIDVFTRKVYCEKMKNKDNNDVLRSMKLILEEVDENPHIIMSDSDSTFLSKKFQTLIQNNNITHDTVVINDHHSLGIVDRFARTLKKRLTKIIENKNNWIDYYKAIVKQYNNRGHKSLGGISPNNADEPDNVALIVEINNLKSGNEKEKFNIGDKVRIDERNIFSKGTEQIFSDQVYQIKSIKGKRITLNNGEIKKDSMLLKVDENTPLGITKKSKLKKIHKEHKNELQYKKESININNIIDGKRKRN